MGLAVPLSGSSSGAEIIMLKLSIIVLTLESGSVVVSSPASQNRVCC